MIARNANFVLLAITEKNTITLDGSVHMGLHRYQ